MFGDARFAPGKPSTRVAGDVSWFAPISEPLIESWIEARKKIAERFDLIPNRHQAGYRSQIDGSRRLAINEPHHNAERLELEILAEAIASLARQLEEQTQQAAITAEEASLALHFRKTKEEIRQALVLLERQGRAKRTSLSGPWVFMA